MSPYRRLSTKAWRFSAKERLASQERFTSQVLDSINLGPRVSVLEMLSPCQIFLARIVRWIVFFLFLSLLDNFLNCAQYNPYQIHYYMVRTVLKRYVGRRPKHRFSTDGLS